MEFIFFDYGRMKTDVNQAHVIFMFSNAYHDFSGETLFRDEPSKFSFDFLFNLTP
jgi:hypothetical protein